jgi:hypothetical protein
MPRLGVPANIHYVRALFRQPRPAAGNALGLQFRQAVALRIERVALGSSRWFAIWEAAAGSGEKAAQLTTKNALIPLAVEVAALFEEQLTPWQAFDYQGGRQEEIDGEIVRQLQEWRRRHPSKQRRQAMRPLAPGAAFTPAAGAG